MKETNPSLWISTLALSQLMTALIIRKLTWAFSQVSSSRSLIKFSRLLFKEIKRDHLWSFKSIWLITRINRISIRTSNQTYQFRCNKRIRAKLSLKWYQTSNPLISRQDSEIFSKRRLANQFHKISPIICKNSHQRMRFSKIGTFR